MLIPDGGAEFEIIIKKSRFISEITPIEDAASAREILKRKKQEHPDAAHVVHAFVAGEQRQYMGMSDDGEPSGTSGKPVLEILKGRGITNLILTVVRYFGGVKLGTGGLVRAYSDAAAGALDKLQTNELIRFDRFELKTDYNLYQPVSTVLKQLECRIEDEKFGTAVEISGLVPEACKDTFLRTITDLSSGRAEIRILAR